MNYQKVLISVGTKKIEQCISFYRAFLGISPSIYKESTYAEFQLEGLILAIFKPRVEEDENFSNQDNRAPLSICLQVDNLELTLLNLNNLGFVSPLKVDSASNIREAHFYDPAGSRIILYDYFDPS